jgi:hypothetical protein
MSQYLTDPNIAGLQGVERTFSWKEGNSGRVATPRQSHGELGY